MSTLSDSLLVLFEVNPAAGSVQQSFVSEIRSFVHRRPARLVRLPIQRNGALRLQRPLDARDVVSRVRGRLARRRFVRRDAATSSTIGLPRRPMACEDLAG